MLTDPGRDYRFALGVLVDLLDYRVGLYQLAVAIVVQAVLFLEVGDLLMPHIEGLAEADTAPVGQQLGQVAVEQADMVPVDPLYLADLGAIDVEVSNVLRVRREPARVTRHTVVETSTDSDQEITVLDSVVGGGDSVHSEHVQGQRMPGIAGAERH